MTRVLVIGAGGQVGSDLVPQLAKRGHELRLVDQRPAMECAGYPSLAKHFGSDRRWRDEWWLACDAARSERLTALIGDFKPEITYHLVAILSATGEKDPVKCWDVNMGSVRLCLDSLSALSGPGFRPRMIWPSSIAAFGPIPDIKGGYPDPTPNEVAMLPRTMYGITKVAGELLGDYYAAKRGVDFRSVRFPGLLSPTPPGGGSSDYANEMYFAAAQGQNCDKVFVAPETTLPFMYMPDAIRALMELAAADESKLTRRTYNIAAVSPTAKEIADSIRKAVPSFREAYKPDHRKAFVDSWPDRLDDSVARRDWGWKHEYGLDAMTRALLVEIRALLKAGASA